MLLLQSPVVIDSSFGMVPIDTQVLVLLLVKLLLLIGALVYLIFSFIIIRQIHIMRSTLITPFSSIILIAGYIHLAFAIGVLVLFAVIL
jgi:hypothetical protein